MLARSNKTEEKNPEAFTLWESQRKSSIWEDRHTLQNRQTLWCICTDKHPHAEVATLIHVYMFLHPKCKSQLHNLWKRCVITCLETSDFVREKRAWLRKGKSKATLIIKDKLRQLGVQREGKEKGDSLVRHRNKDPPPPLTTMFQVCQSSDSMGADNTLTLARVPVLLNELLQTKAFHDTTIWAQTSIPKLYSVI